MKYEVIGVTNDMRYVPEMLGVKSETEIILLESTIDGQFFAKVDAEETDEFGHKVVRLISDYEADRLERRAMRSIEAAEKKVRAITVPEINMKRFEENMAAVQDEVSESSKRMRETIMRRPGAKHKV